MFSASKTVAVFVALAGSIAVSSAAPITGTATKSAPASYATGYLESYQTYHARYAALNCSSHRNGTSVDDFFEDCCRPLLATEALEEARASYCIPSNSSIASASSAAVSATATDSAAEAEYSADATSTYTGIEATTTAEVSAAQALVTSTSETPSSTYVAPTSTYVAPTTTSEAPAATTTASSSGSWNGDAHATYYLQGGVAGACGNVNSDSAYIIALPYAWYGNDGGSASQYCGKSVEIQRLSNGATVTATVADLCPSCTTSNSLDLSVGAFTAIASESEGQVDIQWKFV